MNNGVTMSLQLCELSSLGMVELLIAAFIVTGSIIKHYLVIQRCFLNAAIYIEQE